MQADFENISLEECNVVLSYLTNWLTNHICKVDRRLAGHIHSQRQAEREGVIHYTTEELVAMSTAKVDSGLTQSVSALELTQKHIGDTDEMLEQLEACIEDLKEHCDVMVQSAADAGLSNMSATAHYKCTNGLKLVKSIKRRQKSLKNVLDQI